MTHVIKRSRKEQTPWWLTMWGFPSHRRWAVVVTAFGIAGFWEYEP